MYTLSDLKTAIKTPQLFLRVINKAYHRRLFFRSHNVRGIDIFDEDWDNLIILDACRFDMFKRVNNLPGELKKRVSKGSATKEFLISNFSNKELNDTIYITANPQIHRYWNKIDPKLHEIVDVWEGDNWKEHLGTALPETTTKYALETAEEKPNKRLIVHYMQPHFPFIDASNRYDELMLENPESDRNNIWLSLLSGEADIEKQVIWDAYERNLELALEEVETLLANLEGKTVVTSDHGNMIGEKSSPIPFNEWGHPSGIYIDELVVVPWLVSENGRKVVKKGEPGTKNTEIDSEVVTERLQDLGYRE